LSQDLLDVGWVRKNLEGYGSDSAKPIHNLPTTTTSWPGAGMTI